MSGQFELVADPRHLLPFAGGAVGGQAEKKTNSPRKKRGKTKESMNKQDQAKYGRIGGSKTGPTKARSSEQARAAATVRWARWRQNQAANTTAAQAAEGTK